MKFSQLVKQFTTAVQKGDGHRLASCFREDGTYRDYIYGPFTGRDAIANMLVEHFHGDAQDFYWEMFDLVSDEFTGYARYRFSFTSTMEQSTGKRVAVDGIGQFKLRDGLISEYYEVVNGGIAMSQLGHAPQRMARVFERWSQRLMAQSGWTEHTNRN